MTRRKRPSRVSNVLRVLSVLLLGAVVVVLAGAMSGCTSHRTPRGVAEASEPPRFLEPGTQRGAENQETGDVYLLVVMEGSDPVPEDIARDALLNSDKLCREQAGTPVETVVLFYQKADESLVVAYSCRGQISRQ